MGVTAESCTAPDLAAAHASPAVKPVDALTDQIRTPAELLPFGNRPSLQHVTLPGSSTEIRGTRPSHSQSPSPFHVALHLRPLPSTGITRLLRYYRPLRHPAGPDWPSRGSGWRVHATDRASRVAASFIFHACRRQYPGRYRSVHMSLASRSTDGLPLTSGGSASALLVSRPAQRSQCSGPHGR